MRVLVTGHLGYIGSILTPLLHAEGHEVVGLDCGLYEGCEFTNPHWPVIRSIASDLRDADASCLQGVDAVVNLAGLSNDPLGELSPEWTDEINHRAVARLAALARDAGVQRFVQASSCLQYGASGDDVLDESAPVAPLTCYGHAKVAAEAALKEMASSSFSPVYLRLGTAYGMSPMLRGDLVVNNLTGHAVSHGEVLLKSDGRAWRPLVHVEDIARAFAGVLTADRDAVHDEAFHVVGDNENHLICDVADRVGRSVPNSRVVFVDGASRDVRSYRVSGAKLVERVPGAAPKWKLQAGIEQLRDAYVRENLQLCDLEGPRLLRVNQVQALRQSNKLDETLRWQSPTIRG